MNMKWMYKLEQKFGRYAIRNLSLILIICYAAGYIIQLVNGTFTDYLTLNPYAIVHGQVWRIVSWILIPPTEDGIFFTLIMLFFYYSIGTALERAWGSFQYNVYLFSGMIFTVIGSFLMMGYIYLFKSNEVYLAAPQITEYVFKQLSYCFSTYYVNMSIFLAYAATFPDNQVLLMFIIPIKVKVLGIIYGVFLVYEMVSGILSYEEFGFVYPFVIGSSLLNFLLFFFTTRRYIRMNHAQRQAHRAYRKQAKQAQNMQRKKITKHRCAVCGRTEEDGEDLVFRYCSKCEGNYEFCQDHLYTHVHFTGNGPGEK